MYTSDQELLKDCGDKDYAHAYFNEVVNAYIASQTKVLREQNQWTQKQLADKAGMKQERISLLENVNYSSWSIKTLRKLAKAFDLVLWVSFENFSTALRKMENISKESMERVSRDREWATINTACLQALPPLESTPIQKEPTQREMPIFTLMAGGLSGSKIASDPFKPKPASALAAAIGGR